MLQNLDRWLDKALAHAKHKGYDPNVLCAARLAPDQYALAKQVQAACDSAKIGASRVAGVSWPAHADTEQTIDELRARIRTAIGYLDTLRKEQFDGAEDRIIEVPYLPGAKFLAGDYLREQFYANFYFHVTHAYAILRHNGVELGKMDYFGPVTFAPA
jgi:hypothetical protein